MAEVNCVPLSEVSCAGTPHLEIQPAMRASAQLAAAMSAMGRASNQRDDLSTTGGRWQGAHDVHVDVGEPPGWDGDGLDRRRVLPGSFGSLTLLAVLDPCGHIAVETSPHHPGGNEPLGGPRTGVRQPMEGGENRRPVDQRYQRPHPASGNVTEELYTADHPLLYLERC